MCKRTKFAKLALLGLLTLLVSVTPNKFISLSLKPFHSHFSICEGASAGRGRVPVCAPLGGCSAQRALAGRLPPLARSPLGCSRPGRRNRSDLYRRNELQSPVQKARLRTSLRRSHAAGLKNCTETPRRRRSCRFRLGRWQGASP